MFRKTLIAAVLATVAITAAQPASAGMQPNGLAINGTMWNGQLWNGTAGGAQPATVIAIELPQPK